MLIALANSESFAAKRSWIELVHEEPRRRGADLTGIPELGGDGRQRRGFRIDVAEYHHRSMAAEFQRHPLHGLHSQRAELFADLGRPGEGDAAGDRRAHQLRRDLRGIAEHDIEHAGGQTGIFERCRDRQGRRRGLLGWLDDHRTAGRQRAADLARRRDGGCVPWRKGSDRAERLAHRDLLNGAIARRDHAAIGATTFLGIPRKDARGGFNLDAGFRDRLAELKRDQARDGLGALDDERRSALQDPRALDR